MSTRLVIGIDGGGTSTAAWLADDRGHILGKGEAGASNIKAVGMDSGLGALDAAVAQAFADANLPAREVDIACLGLAGFDRPEDIAILERWNRDRSAAFHLHVVNDGDLVIAAGTPEGWGIGLIAGTGSIAVGIGPDHRKTRAGGWGHLFGDEGSAYGVAIAGLRLTAHRADGRLRDHATEDHLTLRLCEELNVSEPPGLITAVYGRRLDRTTIARLAPLVVEAAQAGDLLAAKVLTQAALDLATTVEAVFRSLTSAESQTWKSLPLALAGGFLLGCETLKTQLLTQLKERVSIPIQSESVPDPVAGGVVLALRELGS